MLKLSFLIVFLCVCDARPIIREPVELTTTTAKPFITTVVTTTAEPLTTTTDEPTVGELLSFEIPVLDVNDDKDPIPVLFYKDGEFVNAVLKLDISVNINVETPETVVKDDDKEPSQ